MTKFEIIFTRGSKTYKLSRDEFQIISNVSYLDDAIKVKKSIYFSSPECVGFYFNKQNNLSWYHVFKKIDLGDIEDTISVLNDIKIKFMNLKDNKKNDSIGKNNREEWTIFVKSKNFFKPNVEFEIDDKLRINNFNAKKICLYLKISSKNGISMRELLNDETSVSSELDKICSDIREEVVYFETIFNEFIQKE